MRESGAYRGRYASIIAGYRVTPGYIDRHLVCVADAGREGVLGFCSVVCEPPELDLAFVTDEAQGRGVGRLLVEQVLQRAREAGLSDVRVVSHPPSEAFYRRLGARRTGTVPPAPPKVAWERPELWFDL
ncbi:GNAT family N-acetyltransferase [Streptomyces monticola]|uniref:GNAT family N-acetyltransferase n=1 Tax=Streptomyces monticola TaxID=2666263 RepID=A0ABW2JQG1_9ACTN